MSKDVKREIMKADVFFLKVFFFSFFLSLFFFLEKPEAYHAKFYIGGINLTQVKFEGKLLKEFMRLITKLIINSKLHELSIFPFIGSLYIQGTKTVQIMCKKSIKIILKLLKSDIHVNFQID